MGTGVYSVELSGGSLTLLNRTSELLPIFLFYLLYNIVFFVLGHTVSQNDIVIFGNNYT